MTENNKPVKKFVAVPVSVSIWEQTGEKDGKKYSFNTLTLQRTYKDKEDNYQNTQSLRVNDIPKAELVLRQAFEYLTQLQESN